MYRNRSNISRERNQNPSAALNSAPRAIAFVKGGEDFPDITGDVRFFDTESGVFVIAELNNLPVGPQSCESDFFGFHIHEGLGCGGEGFANTLSHYNPSGMTHPHHAGDMPPLLCSDGYAFLAFITNRFTIDEIMGRTVVIHSMRDDFTSQPSGDSGEKIACGVISGTAR